MRFSIPALSAAQILIATNPEIGVDSIVHVSPTEVVKLGKIIVDAAGTPTWYPRAGASLGVGGMDIHLRLETAIAPQATLPTVTLDCTLVGPVADATAVAALTVPSWVADQAKVFPIGHALDFVPAGVGNSALLVTAIAGVESVANMPPNSEFTVWGSPAQASFVEIGYKRGAEGAYSVPSSVAIADGHNPAGAIKTGRPEIPELNLSFAHISAMAGMGRYNGLRTSIWLKVLKDKAVHSANIVYCGARPSTSPSRGDGNDEVVETTTGPYEAVLLFDAN